MRIGYKRVSTVDQNTTRQDLGDVDRIYEDHITGKTRDRPELNRMLDRVEPGDQVVVYSTDRLGRSLKDLIDLVNIIVEEKGASIHFIEDNLTFSSGEDANEGDMLRFHLMAALAEYERKRIRRRSAEGIAFAKLRGVYKGRKRSVDREAVWRLLDAGFGPKKVADTLKIGVSSVYRVRDERTENSNI